MDMEKIALNIKYAKEKYKLKLDLPKCIIAEIYKRIDNNQLEDFTPEGLEDIYNQLIPQKVRWSGELKKFLYNYHRLIKLLF